MRHRKKILLIFSIILLVLLVCLFQQLRPTIVIHTHIKSGYLGKISTSEGHIDKLYTKNYIARYKLPYKWKTQDEVAIFTKNYNDVLRKEDIDFCRLDVFLDENGFYKSHSKSDCFCLLFCCKK